MPTTTRKQTPVQARKSALESDYTPLYAVAGLTDVVADAPPDRAGRDPGARPPSGSPSCRAAAEPSRPRSTPRSCVSS